MDFANELFLAACFTCTLDYGNNVSKKQICAIFLFEFKIGHKAVEITHNINNALAQKLLMNIQCSGGSRSFVRR